MRTVETLRLQADRRKIPPLVPLSAEAREQDLVLSFTQERMWFLDQLQPGLTAYNVPGAVYMDGRLSKPALVASFVEILARHEVFRTTYAAVDGRPVQVIHDSVPFALPVVDLTSLAPDDREDVALALAKDNAGRPFDLATGPVLRPILTRMGPERHLMAVTTHHIAYDMWARETFIFELGSLYGAYVQGDPSPLDAPFIQYADYAAWQRGWLQGEVLEEELGFWKERLAAAPGHLELTTDKPRLPVQTYAGRRQYLKMSKDLVRRVGELARARGVTPFITVLAAFKALLVRYTGQTDMVVGSPIANRNRREVEGLIGFLSNTLVLYTDLGGDPAFGDALERVRDTALDAYGHQDVPFELLVHELLLERDMSRAPLFQVMFNYMLSYSAPTVDLPELTLRVERLHSGAAQFDVNVDMWETGDGLYGVVEYNTDLFHDTTITRLVGHFESLLTGAVDDPSRRLSELPLLTGAERHHLLRELAGTDRPYDLDTTYPELVEAVVRATPDRVAAVTGVGEFGEETALTYGELWRRSGELARVLLARGVGTDHVVGLLAPRDVPLFIAMIAVLRTGAAYLPLDPGHPAERWKNSAEQSQADLVLVTNALRPALERVLGDARGNTWIPVEPLRDVTGVSLEGPAVPTRAGSRESLSYVIPTSGTSGRPKGVAVPQRALLNHIRVNTEYFDLTDDDVLAQTASASFDISVWQFLTMATLGGRVDLYGEDLVRDPMGLLRTVHERRVTVFQTVPSLMAVMLDEMDPAVTLDGLRWMLLTGEALPPELARRWWSHFPDMTLVDTYGPIEVSDDATLGKLRPDYFEEDPWATPLGRPCQNTRLVLVDRWDRPTPMGQVGQLLVGGAGVGRGYRGRPAQTAAAYGPDFLHDRQGEDWRGGRLYRTGDLCRLLPDGRIVYLGRMDKQFKIHGNRIEPEEIESLITEASGVRQAVVIPRDEQLVAYVARGRNETVDASALRRVLKEFLPHYMVPSSIVVLKEIPLTPNGKVDRKALPPPKGRPSNEAYVAPRDVVEEVLATIFQESLGIEMVGVSDDFFALGGHSLLATQMLSRIHESFGVNIPLSTLFLEPTIASVGRLLRDEHLKGISSDDHDERSESRNNETGVVAESKKR